MALHIGHKKYDGVKLVTYCHQSKSETLYTKAIRSMTG